jgi:hypothetical protein
MAKMIVKRGRNMGNCAMFGLEPRFLAQSRQFREPASVKLFGFGGGSVRIRTAEIIGVKPWKMRISWE